MVRRLTQILGIALIVLLGTSFYHRDTETTETEIVIIKAPEKPRHPYQDEYEKLLYPTVRITAGCSTGSGVVFTTEDTENTEQIYILTAAHVVQDESSVTIEFFYPVTKEIQATVVITDTAKDLALLSGLCGSVTKAKLAPQNYTPYLFTPIWAVGCSLGLPPRPSSGCLSAFSGSCYEISAPILPGNSGGPVYDARTYEVIGIAVWVKVYNGQLVTTMAGVVPINEIYNFLDNHKQ
ncbi:MAG: serine protease [Planctomycetota bacterium]